MAELEIKVAACVAEPYAAVPTLSFDLRVTDPAGQRVQALALRAQIRIEPQLRTYTPEETDRLVELFGRPLQWSESLRPWMWTQASTVVGTFTGTSQVALPVACTYDFEVSAARYMHSLDGGDIPLVLLFSGTIFRSGPAGLMVEPIAWNTEARHRLPVATWRDLMDKYFPGGGWMRLRRETIDALGRVKAREAFPTWEETIAYVMKQAGEEV